MERGKIVKVYSDPVTEESLEGEAKLVRKLNGPIFDDLEYWRVRFISGGDLADRWVKQD